MHFCAAILYLTLHNLAKLKQHTDFVTDLANQYDLLYFAKLADLFQSLLKLGSGDRVGLAEFKDVDASLVSANTLGLLAPFRIEACHRAMAIGLNDEALQLANSIQDLIAKTDVKLFSSDLHRIYAVLAKANGDNKAAEKHFFSAIDVARKQGTKLYELRAAIAFANFWRDQGRTAEAISLLQPVYDSIAEGDCPEDQAMARELLAQLKV
jgi:tetratricopeptide (TPR) repeat protein